MQVKLLLAKGVDKNGVYEKLNMTLIFAASTEGHVDLVRYSDSYPTNYPTLYFRVVIFHWGPSRGFADREENLCRLDKDLYGKCRVWPLPVESIPPLLTLSALKTDESPQPKSKLAFK